MTEPEETLTLKPIAHYYGPVTEKFGLPRQSGLVPELKGRIVFTQEYRMPEALRGLDGFSHIWLIWGFSKNHTWSPMVRPPRLGGNERRGVFATRSPFRPNPLGLSVVRLERIQTDTPEGSCLIVSGADLMSGTPVYDLKPYVPYADIRKEATGGFAAAPDSVLPVHCPDAFLALFSEEAARVLLKLLSLDPRPHYQTDPGRVYGMAYEGRNVKFRVTPSGVEVVGVE